MDEQRRRIANFLASRNTLSLATCADDTPWAASVFFASDDELKLYFVTDPKTLHGRHLEGGAVAGTVNEDCSEWAGIQGVQLSGTARRVADDDRPRVLALYLRKFGEVRRMVEQPATDEERMIGERLAATPFYCITPNWVRLIDNRIRFGFKEELQLD